MFSQQLNTQFTVNRWFQSQTAHPEIVACVQEAAEDALSMFSQQLNTQFTVDRWFPSQTAHPEIVACVQEAAEDVLSMFSQQLNTQYTASMTAKMGLQKYDKDLAVDLLTNMYEDKTGTLQWHATLLWSP